LTPFRKSQARAVLESIVRGLAPQVCSLSSLHAAVWSVADDPRLWAEIKAKHRAAKAAETSSAAANETTTGEGNAHERFEA
jgi:hydroxyethylthiazole kinase-like sugar kinase family protein